MKIALITPGFSASKDDWCIPALLNLVGGLAKEHQVTVFTLRYPYKRAVYSVAGATVHALGGGTVRGLGRGPLLWKVIRLVISLGPFDLIHGCWADESGAVATWTARQMGVPVVVSLLGGELVNLPDISYGGQRSLIGRTLTRYSLRHADCVTVGSRYLAEIASKFVGAEKIVERPLGVDSTLFRSESRLQNDSLRLVHVGSLIGVKDQSTLILALARVVVEVPSVELHIAGSGPLREKLAQMASGLGVADHLHFCGEVAHDRLPALYAAADLFVMSSRYESQCMTLLEAVACGCPAVGTDVGLFPQLLPPTNVTPVGDAEALANAIIAMLQSPEQRRALARELQTTVQEHYTLEHTLTKWNDTYRHLIVRQGTHAARSGS